MMGRFDRNSWPLNPEGLPPMLNLIFSPDDHAPAPPYVVTTIPNVVPLHISGKLIVGDGGFD